MGADDFVVSLMALEDEDVCRRVVGGDFEALGSPKLTDEERQLLVGVAGEQIAETTRFSTGPRLVALEYL